jgi:hypothetical protein
VKIETKADCPTCHEAINPFAFVKSGGKQYHIACFLTGPLNDAREEAREEERVKYQATLKEYEERLGKAIAKGPAPSVANAPPPIQGPMTYQEWDAEVEIFLGKYIADFGPSIPRGVMKSFLWRAYKMLAEKKLILPWSDDLAPKAPERKVTLDEFLKGEK